MGRVRLHPEILDVTAVGIRLGVVVPDGDGGRLAVREEGNPVVLHLRAGEVAEFDRGMVVSIRFPLDGREEAGAVGVDKVPEGAGVFLIEIEPIEQCLVLGDRGAHVHGRTVEIVGADLLLGGEVEPVHRLLGDHVHETSRLRLPVEHGGGSLDHLDVLDIRHRALEADVVFAAAEAVFKSEVLHVEATDGEAVPRPVAVIRWSDAADILQGIVEINGLLVLENLLRNDLLGNRGLHDGRLGACRSLRIQGAVAAGIVG